MNDKTVRHHPLRGRAEVSVNETQRGYEVRIHWPDSPEEDFLWEYGPKSKARAEAQYAYVLERLLPSLEETDCA